MLKGFLFEDCVDFIFEEIEGGIGDNFWEEFLKFDEKMFVDYLCKEYN